VCHVGRKISKETEMQNQELYDKAMAAITELFSDESVSKEVCIGNLDSLIGEIETMKDSLET